jgi:hypothetical protein
MVTDLIRRHGIQKLLQKMKKLSGLPSCGDVLMGKGSDVRGWMPEIDSIKMKKLLELARY